jgi:hypothetical protein
MAARRSDDVDEAPDGLGVGDGRAAEFLDDHPTILPYFSSSDRLSPLSPPPLFSEI